MKKWVLIEEKADIPLMSATLGISETLAQALVNRHVRTKNTAIKFLNPKRTYMYDPFLMKDMAKAVDIVYQAANERKRIVIYGDYDVDGVMSAVILYKTLRQVGADVSFYIPNRETEGYGLNMAAVKLLHERGTALMITCDNGVAAVAEIARAKTLGMQVVVIDHHETGGTLPAAEAMVNPKRSDCTYPFEALCAAGLCYKFAAAFHAAAGLDFGYDEEFLVLAMLATICDIVDLQDENRIIVKEGLAVLNQTPALNLGLHALIEAKGYGGKEITAFTVGFVLGPCINATGRLEKATNAAMMLVTEDEEMARLLAARLVELNEIRRNMTEQCFLAILERLEASGHQQDKVLVIYDEETHESIAGIVAGRLKERLYKPAVVLTPAAGGWVKGSARSIEGYNIFEAMHDCRHLFERFGGHAMAAGLTLHADHVSEFRRYLNTHCTLTDEDYVEIIKIDKVLPLQAATFELAQELAHLSPFGKANKEPLFKTTNVKIEHLRVIENKNTIIFTFRADGSHYRIKGICFGLVDVFKAQLTALYDEKTCEKVLSGVLRDTNFVLDMVYALDINTYNESTMVQLKLRDFILRKN